MKGIAGGMPQSCVCRSGAGPGEGENKEKEVEETWNLP
jgi:hypothetical protein